VSLSLALLALSQATTIAGAQLALGVRTTISLTWVAISVTLARRITGFEARGFARAMTAVLLLVAGVSFFVPLNGTVTGLLTAEAWWGGTFTIVRREPLLQRWERAVLEGVEAVGPATPAGRRLRDTADFFEFLQAEMPAMLERWRVQRSH